MKTLFIIAAVIVFDFSLSNIITYIRGKKQKKAEDEFLLNLEALLKDKDMDQREKIMRAKDLCRNTESKMAAGAYVSLNNIPLPEQEVRPGRYVGNTTRLIDKYVQEFFDKGSCIIRDHYDTAKSNDRVLDVFLTRLVREHNIKPFDLIINRDLCKVTCANMVKDGDI